MKKVAISIGDLNGIGIQLALENHHMIKKLIHPLYCIDKTMLERVAHTLKILIPDDFSIIEENIHQDFHIEAGVVSRESGAYAFASFKKAVDLARERKVDAICTLPIHKKAWEKAGISYKGHTDALRDFFASDAIMMLGCEKMFVALFSEHIPLKEVASSIKEKDLIRFFVDFYHEVQPSSTVGVLGLNPHAGDDGVLGDEERIINHAIHKASSILKKENPKLLEKKIFTEALVPDVAFSPNMRKKYTYFIAMYHDQGLAPLKALYFDEGINISLNLPILRTSVDHGTAFDIAYSHTTLNNLSYINAIKYIIKDNT